MAQTLLITLTTAGSDAGPFDLYTDVDSYAVPFVVGVPKATLLAGYVTSIVPDAATIIRVRSNSSLCTNFIDLSIAGITTTTTTSTSTAVPTTTTTTTNALPAAPLTVEYATGFANQSWAVRFNPDSLPSIAQDVTISSDAFNTFPYSISARSWGPLEITGPNTLSVSVSKLTNGGNLQDVLSVALYINGVQQIPNFSQSIPANFSSFVVTHTSIPINPGDLLTVQISEG